MLAFDIALALVVVAVVLFIVKAVRQTRGEIDRRLRGTDPRRRDAIARDLAARIREQADRVVASIFWILSLLGIHLQPGAGKTARAGIHRQGDQGSGSGMCGGPSKVK